MTGAELLGLVTHALEGPSVAAEQAMVNTNLLAALNGCVLLTADEAEKVRQAVEVAMCGEWGKEQALALLGAK